MTRIQYFLDSVPFLRRSEDKRLEFLINDESARAVYWDGKVSKTLGNDEALSLLKILHKKPAHA